MTTYVTFGQVHIHSINGRTFDKDCIAVIPAESQEEGRELVFEYFGDKFCFEYFNQMPNMKYFPRGLISVF